MYWSCCTSFLPKLKEHDWKIISTKVDAGNLKHELLNRLWSILAVNVALDGYLIYTFILCRRKSSVRTMMALCICWFYHSPCSVLNWIGIGSQQRALLRSRCVQKSHLMIKAPLSSSRWFLSELSKRSRLTMNLEKYGFMEWLFAEPRFSSSSFTGTDHLKHENRARIGARTAQTV
jgi:hypothetical protein